MNKNWLFFSFLVLVGCATDSNNYFSGDESQSSTREIIKKISSPVIDQTKYVCGTINEKIDTATIDVEFNNDGNIISSNIVQTSGSNRCDELLVKAIYGVAPVYEIKNLNSNEFEKFKIIRFIINGKVL